MLVQTLMNYYLYILWSSYAVNRPDKQLGGSVEDGRRAAAEVQRLHARPHHVRGPVLDGARRLSAGTGTINVAFSRILLVDGHVSAQRLLEEASINMYLSDLADVCVCV